MPFSRPNGVRDATTSSNKCNGARRIGPEFLVKEKIDSGAFGKLRLGGLMFIRLQRDLVVVADS